MSNHCPILIVEDCDEDFEVTCWALEQAGFTGPILRCVRAEDALRQLRSAPSAPGSASAGPRPCAVLLDLNLPGMNGQQLLEELRRGERPPAIPIIILSTSTNPRDIAVCYRLGAAGYLCKPLSIDLYVEKMRGLISYLFDIVTLPDEDR